MESGGAVGGEGKGELAAVCGGGSDGGEGNLQPKIATEEKMGRIEVGSAGGGLPRPMDSAVGFEPPWRFC